MKKLIFVLLSVLLGSPVLQAQFNTRCMSRGAEDGELYISWMMHRDNDYIYFGTFYSDDDGAHIQKQHQSAYSLHKGMLDHNVLATNTPGQLFNMDLHSLWLSNDYGVSWEQVNNNRFSLFTGLGASDVYAFASDGRLWHSTDDGHSFNQIVDSAGFIFSRAGYQAGEFYGYSYHDGAIYIAHTTDWGQTYEEYIEPEEGFSGICRGHIPGEVYFLQCIEVEHKYKVYYSSDNGEHWTLIYQIDDMCGFDSYMVRGYDPGEVYVEFWQDGGRYKFTIDHIQQYGDSATRHVHYLNDYYEPLSTPEEAIPATALQHYPNPFTEQVHIVIPPEYTNKNTVLQVFNSMGTQVSEQTISGQTEYLWHAKDAKGNRLPNGIYFYRLKSLNKQTPFAKILLEK